MQTILQKTKTTIKKSSKFNKLAFAVFVLIFAGLGSYFSFFSEASSIPGDINNDGTVNITDLSLLLSSYGSSNSPACVTASQYTCDINTDGYVNVVDLSILLSNYGNTNPAVTLSANPTTINSGQSSTLSWTSTNATSCTASASPTDSSFTGTKATNGSQSVSPNSTTTYTLTCSGAAGTTNATKNVTVTVSSGTTSIYWGARIDGQFYADNYGSSNADDTPWAAADPSPNNWDLFVSHAGKANTAVQWGGNPSSWPSVAYDTNAANLARSRGAFSQYDWGTNATGLSDILANNTTAKTNLGALATAIKNQGNPVLFRPLWEMNGNWFNWGTSHITAAQYITIWQNIWQIFADVESGYTAGSGLGTDTGNVSFFWCPNIWSSGGSIPSSAGYWPGSKYVDWMGFDGYAYDAAYVSPANTFDYTYNAIASLDSSKPIGIGEFGVGATIGTPGKAAWFNDFFNSWIPNHPRTKYINYFNEAGSPTDPWIEVPDTARQAFAAGIGNSKYTSNIVNSTSFPNGHKVPVP